MKQILALVFTSISLVACVGGDDDGGGIAIADLGDAVVAAVCEQQVRCGQSPDLATCKATIGLGGLDQLVALVEAGRTQYDSASAANCLDTLRNGSCTVSGFTGVAPASCDATFTGTAAEGAPCVANEECVSEDCEQTGQCMDTCCMGACAAATVPAEIGGTCDEEGCVLTAGCSDGVCVARIAEGAACSDGSPCVLGTFCQPDESFMNFTCEGFPAHGEACRYGCDELDDYCDMSTMICAQRRAVGETCAGGGDCVGYATCESGACVVLPSQAGAACVEQCLGNLECASGICMAREPEPVCL